MIAGDTSPGIHMIFPVTPLPTFSCVVVVPNGSKRPSLGWRCERGIVLEFKSVYV